MVVIRLARGGAKKRPFYHIVAADKRNPRDGRNIEQIGYYNPVARGADTGLYIDLERIKYWQSVGAKPSDRIKFLLKKYQKQLLAKEAAEEEVTQAPEKAKAEEPAVATEPKQEESVQAQEETSTDTQVETGSTDTTEVQDQKSQTEAGEKS